MLTTPSGAGAVQAQVDDRLALVQARTGWHARNLSTGESFGSGADDLFSTGSAAKALICLSWAEQVTNGTLDPDQRISLGPAIRGVGGSGVLRYLGDGLALTLADLAFLMITISDNVATDLLLEAVGGPDAVNELTARIGAADARVTASSAWVYPPQQLGTASPRALAEAYAALAKPEDVGYSPEAAQLARAVFRRHHNTENLSRKLPWSIYATDFGIELPVTVFSKSGSYPSVMCEAGLYETPASGSWVLAVMFDSMTDPRAGSSAPSSEAMADIGEWIFQHWAG